MAVVEHFSKVITFYRLLALHLISSKGTITSRCEIVLYIALNVCIISVLCNWIYNHQQEVIFTDNIKGYLVDYSKFLLIVFTYYSLVIENGLRNRVLQEVWRELDRLQLSIPRADWSSQQRKHFVLLACFISYMSWWELTYAYCVPQSRRGTNFTVTFWVLFLLLHLRQLQIVMYTDLLGFCLASLNVELTWTIELSKGASRFGGIRTDGQIYEHLRSLMEAFGRVEWLVQLLNRTFGYSFAIIKYTNHTYILTDSYWIVYGFTHGRVLNSLYLQCCLSSKFICLMLNLHSNEQIEQQCCRMRELLHRFDLRWQLRCDRGYQMVQSFLQQLEFSQPLALTAVSMYRMDYVVMMQVWQVKTPLNHFY
ncbi:uncharacterized protein LOC128723763 [Anopheles nili]|uniref:uncharacterized protein LOC128723763 n=1 Tax=Anopheles nili TaxID=185578 RepID=UPI00237BAC77|nr:uncharacterized protein LOC128723763 [Anopheles nili]